MWLINRVCNTRCEEGSKAVIVCNRHLPSVSFPSCYVTMQRMRTCGQSAQVSANQLLTLSVVLFAPILLDLVSIVKQKLARTSITEAQ